MAQNTNLQERYGSIVEAKLRATSIFANLFNNRYIGEPKAGAVKVPVRAEATVADYDLAEGVTATLPSTSYETIVLDKVKGVSELIPGYVAAAVPDDIVADRLDSIGYALGGTVDADLLTALKTGTGTADTSTSKVKAIINTIASAKALGVNPASIWVAVSPATEAKIMTDDLYVHAAADVAGNLAGTLAGVPVYVSNRMTDSFIVANSDFCHFVDEWNAEPSVQDLADADHINTSAVKGLKIYGYLISKPETVFVGA